EFWFVNLSNLPVANLFPSAPNLFSPQSRAWLLAKAMQSSSTMKTRQLNGRSAIYRYCCNGALHKNSPNIKRSSPLQQIEKIRSEFWFVNLSNLPVANLFPSAPNLFSPQSRAWLLAKAMQSSSTMKTRQLNGRSAIYRYCCNGALHKNSPNIKRSSPLQQIEKI